MKHLICAASVLLGALPFPAVAASFDCAAARAPIELLICRNDELSALDGAMGEAYAERRKALGEAAADEQRLWLRQRLTACGIPGSGSAAPPPTAVRCLADLYRARIAALQPPAAAGVRLGESVFPARGQHAAVFDVDRLGRYAVRVESAAGVALQLVDRMAGPSEVAGEKGVASGRIDRILDRGSYKAVLSGRDDAQGDARLRVDAFRELNGAAPPSLVELKPVASDLDDLTQRSWWIEIPVRRAVTIEVAGRHLADLRLWKDGTWLVDAASREATVEPETGRPLAVRRIATQLEPGLYLLTAYGGPAQPWAEQSSEKPLHLRWGIPMLAEVARSRFVASPFGVDRFIAPPSANVFRLTLGEADVAALGVGAFDASAPFAAAGARQEIAKNSRTAVAEIAQSFSRGNNPQLVTVERRPGEPYLLENFRAAPVYSFSAAGDHWIEAFASGSSEDEADVTGVLTQSDGRGGETVVAYSAIELAPGQAWRRRFNLQELVTLHVALPAGGEYVAEASGDNVEAEMRFEPLGPQPSTYRPPAFERSGHVWTLEAGFYRFTVTPRPERKGVATVTIRPAAHRGDVPLSPRLGVVAFRNRSLGAPSYRVHLNRVGSIRSGLVLRRLPVDLAQDLPMTLRPSESLTLPVVVPSGGPGTLEALGEDGRRYDLALDQERPAQTVRATPGTHRVRIRNDANEHRSVALRFRPDSLRPEAPLPVLSADRLRQIPDFPVLTAQRPVFLDVAGGELRTFNVSVAAPALYRLETSGLLRTHGNLRTRTVTSLLREEANGTGRNFLLQTYLREGDYQMSFGPGGKSAGHLGLHLEATPLRQAGNLVAGLPSRATLKPGEALAFDFRVDRPGSWTVQALGLHRPFAMRVEDADGWPVASPVLRGPLTQEFSPGRYRALVLPQAVEGRVLALLEEVKEKRERTGHGPHAIALDETVNDEWLEPAAGGERTPDRWRFALPASADVAIELGEGVIGTLWREAPGGDTIAARYVRSPAWNGPLEAGSYRLDVTALRPNNHLPYALTVRSQQLLVGQSRSLRVPGEVAISLGGNDLVEIASFGTADVRARLLDAEGRLVAANDDRPDDWNFSIASTLPPGPYRLLLDGKGQTRVDLLRPEARDEPTLAVPGEAGFADTAVHAFPLELTRAGLLVIAADAPDPVSLALERRENDVWRTIALTNGAAPFLAVPLEAGSLGEARLRAWSTDRKPSRVRIAARLVPAQPVSEAELSAGLALKPIDGIEPRLGALSLAPASPGLFRVDGDVRWTGAVSFAASTDVSRIAVAKTAPLWLVGRDTGPVRVRRAPLETETKFVLPPGGGEIAIGPEPGPLL
jgi:uncharacterized protein YecT (DUF1311 family)